MEEQSNTPNNQPVSVTHHLHPTTRKRLGLGLLALIVVVGLALAIVHPGSKTTDTISNPKFTKIEPAQITISDDGFMPETVTIRKGQSVIWANKSSAPHQVATDPYPQENGLLGFVQVTASTPNDTYSYMFVRTGTFTYHDHLNPDRFHGTVVVK